MTYSIVVPTVGRDTLDGLLSSLAACVGPRPERIVLVDDRPGEPVPLRLGDHGWVAELIEVRHSGGRGPAAARNVGWRCVDDEWVVFLDDDVRVTPSWLRELADDLAAAQPQVAGVQARVEVPLPKHRRPTDWERGTAGLSAARWITADLAYRRSVLAQLGGFDERFPRAFREDADLALRCLDAGYDLRLGTRHTVHPVRSAPWWASVRAQRGNADDALMRRRHGPDWRARAGEYHGRLPQHVLTVTCAAGVLAATALHRKAWRASAVTAWALLTARFAWLRIEPGPRTPGEIAAMTATSVLIPPAACWHRVRGELRHRGAPAWPESAPPDVEAVLIDRDGTLVHDVPYNGVPERVETVDGAADALQRLRAAGVKVGVVTNQSGVARGYLDPDQVHAVNARVEELLGPFDTWQVCVHGEDDGCACRKPRPGMVYAAARELGVPVRHCVVIGDTAADVQAGQAAGAASILVPNRATRPDEVREAPAVYATLGAAVDGILRARGGSR